MRQSLRLLCIENSHAEAEPLLELLRHAEYEPQALVVTAEADLRAALDRQPWDLILCGHPLAQVDVLEAIKHVRGRGLDIPFIVVSGSSGEEFAADAMRAGAADFVLRQNPARLIPAIARELRDVAERRAWHEAEAALRLRDRSIAAISQGVLITDPNQPDNPVVYANPAFERITGYTAAETLGKNCRFLQGRETDKATVAEIRRAIRKGRECAAELLNYRKDGTPFWNSLTISPLLDDAGRVTHFVGVLTDVTERRRLEELYRHSQKLENVGQLAGGVAHDFNNLLTVVTGYSEMLLHDLPPDDEHRTSIEEIHKAGERGTKLTKQLLAFSRKQLFSTRIVDLNAVLTDMERLIRRLIREDIELATVFRPGLHPVQVDPHQVEMAVMNMVVNARDAMPKGGRLTIETSNAELDENYARYHPGVKPGPYVLLQVSDTGQGMDDATRQRLFEPFFTTKPKGVGTGLGLATVYGIVRQSGGHVSVYSEPGLGAVFKIYFPRAVLAAATSVEIRPSAGNLRGAETVLLVEDDESVRSLARSVLQTHGYRVLDAGDAQAALRLCDEHAGQIHLVLTDMVMPRMSGQELAQRIESIRPGVRVLYTSGYSYDTVVQQGILTAGAPFIQKPYSSEGLAKKVREILDKHA